MEYLIKRAAFLWRCMLKDGKWDNGDLLQSAFASMLNEGKTVEDDKLDKFEEILIKKIQEHVDNDEYNMRFYLRLAVDYHPDKVLAEAAKEAEIPEGRFPCKTSLYINWEEDNVATSYGYGAPEETHYHQEGKWLVICGRKFVDEYVSHKLEGTEMPNVDLCGERGWPSMGIK